MAGKSERVGLWMVGACGGVGSTVALGIAATRKKLAGGTGLVSELPLFKSAGLAPVGSIVVGGHEVRRETLLEAVTTLHRRAELFDEGLIRYCAPQLRAFQRNVRPGTLKGSWGNKANLAGIGRREPDQSQAEAVERLSADIVGFRRKHGLAHVVVVNVASSEPAVTLGADHGSYVRCRRALARRGNEVLPSSSLYALAAIEANCPFINFTASAGVVPAIAQRAAQLGVPYMGNDGKTGETLVKSALAPMFAVRNLSVLSWVGQNILGNRDGLILRDPRTRRAKVKSKDKVLSQIIGDSAVTRVSIDYVPSLDDRKVAWDFIHFQGFLGTKMSMQFIWQGSDSILAAPLVIDLARLGALEARKGRGGPMKHLACFFKDPIGVNEQSLFAQWRLLVEHIQGAGSAEEKAARFAPPAQTRRGGTPAG